jgi:hypothetical protein
MIATIAIDLELEELHETLSECRSEPGLDYASELAVMRLTGLTDEQIYCQWLTEANWLTMGDDPGLFARMQIDEPIAYGAGDLQHLMIAAAESNPLWHKTFNQGLQEIDTWRTDVKPPVMATAESFVNLNPNPKPVPVPSPNPKPQSMSMERLFTMRTIKTFVGIALNRGKTLLIQFRARAAQARHIQKQLQAFTTKFSGMALQQASRMIGARKNKSELL